MNTHELPMILFTVLAQMSAGAFVVLGCINVVSRVSGRYSENDLDQVSDPAILAIGGSLILGLGASSLHMNDPFNVLNVFRHIDSSWLSREIVSGMVFAGLGFVYAAMQIFKIGSGKVRQILAVLTALAGLVLVWSMSMIYYSVNTVPAWHTWITPVRFFATTGILGALSVGASFMTVVMLRRRGAFRRLGERLGPATYTPQARDLVLRSLRAIAVAVVALMGVILLLEPMLLTHLADEIGGLESIEAYAGTAGIVRIILLVLGAGLASLFLYRTASKEDAPAGRMATIVTLGFICVLAAEFMARYAFYESMFRIGI